MRFSGRIGLIALVSATFSAGTCLIASAQTVQLATFDAAPTTVAGSGKDFDPQLDTTLSCSGCWTGRTLGSGVTYSQSTTNGVTQGTGALQATIVGHGSGGEYSAQINGVAANLDTHFDYPLVVTYTNNVNANGGVLDPRFTAVANAVNGVKPKVTYTIDFDIVYDVAQMRSIAWQPPKETVAMDPDPEDPNVVWQYPQRFFWTGMWGNTNGAPNAFTFTGFDENNINPFDSDYDTNLFPVFNASFPLEDFNFPVNPATAPTEYRFGILYNSVMGTLPAASNTAGVHVFFDNLRLVEHSPLDVCDLNGSSTCDISDFQLFMGQHLTTGEIGTVLGDYDLDGDNDFGDYQEFEAKYDIQNSGAGSLSRDLAAVPEPTSLVLVALSMIGLMITRVRRLARPALPLLLAAGVVAIGQQAAQAQIGVEKLLEGFETTGRWAANPGAAQGANAVVAYQSAKGVSQGTRALKVTQEVILTGDGFSWNAAINPNWTGAVVGPPAVPADPAFLLLRDAVNIGAEHFNVLVDTHFDPVDLPSITAATVTLGLNFTGQTAATYAGEAAPFSTTTTIPLSAFNLADVEDQGATNYSAQIGITATGDVDPFSVYVDNLRLVQVTAPDLLTLEIDRSNGLGKLKNLSPNPIAWDYMTIKSVGGAMDVAGWNNLDEQGLDGNLWVAAGGSSPNNLVEGNNTGSHTLAPGAELSLGNLLNESLAIGDVDLEIRRVGSPVFRTYDQIVTYINDFPVAQLIGDYNGDNKVDAADYTRWRDNVGAPGSTLLKRDPANTGPVGPGDYASWKTHFGQTSPGAGSFASTQVPEPSMLVLSIGAVAAACLVRRRSTDQR